MDLKGVVEARDLLVVATGIRADDIIVGVRGAATLWGVAKHEEHVVDLHVSDLAFTAIMFGLKKPSIPYEYGVRSMVYNEKIVINTSLSGSVKTVNGVRVYDSKALSRRLEHGQNTIADQENISAIRQLERANWIGLLDPK